MKLKDIIKLIATFVIVATVLITMLCASALIPRRLIKQKTIESARFLNSRFIFENLIPDISATKYDRYGDCVVLSMCYQFDREHPFKSVMKSEYYSDISEGENFNLLLSVQNDLEPNQQYLRYWHGYIAILRPLLIFMTIKQIYYLNGALLTALLVWLLVRLWKRKYKDFAVALLVSYILTFGFLTPMCIDFVWMYYIWLIGTHIALNMCDKKKYENASIFFLTIGIMTSFFDFLTTELLTLFIPMLLIVYVRMLKDNEEFKKIRNFTILNSFIWLVGYAVMWSLKWLLASVAMNENAMKYVTHKIKERTTGEVGLGRGEFLFKAVWFNIKEIFPMNLSREPGNIFMLLLVILVGSFFGFVYAKTNFNKQYCKLLTEIALIPYIRYLVMHNHSYIHYFFVYRIQMITLLAIFLILFERIDNKYFKRKK